MPVFPDQTFQVPKMEESENLYKLSGYGLCKGKPTPKIDWNKVTRKPSILGTEKTFAEPIHPKKDRMSLWYKTYKIPSHGTMIYGNNVDTLW